MKKLTGILLMAFTLSVGTSMAQAKPCADAINMVSGLGAATKQQMIVTCEQKKLATVNSGKSIVSNIDSPEEISEWANVSKEFAKAIGIAAKELGIATNEFLQTPAGKMTAALIIWHVAGENILGAIIGIPMLLFFWWILSSVLRNSRKGNTTYAADGARHWWGPRIITEQELLEHSEDRSWYMALAYIALLIGTCMITGLVIF